MRAVAYVRVSTDEQTTSGAGLDAQLHAIREHCDKHGIELVGTFADEGISGAAALDKRTGLLDAVNAVERGGILLVSKRDRLSRDPVSTAVVERMIAKRRGRIVSAAGEGTDGDAPTDILLRRMVDAFSEHERLVIAARTRAALKSSGQTLYRVSMETDIGQDVLSRFVREEQVGLSLQLAGRLAVHLGYQLKRG